nr:hypothetical protein [uncultured Dongia sp.]
MKKLMAGALLLLLGACGTGVSSDFKATTKKIAILSFAGHQFNALQNIQPGTEAVNRQIDALNGTLPIWTEQPGLDKVYAGSQEIRWKHNISDWGIDAFAVTTATALLAPKYQIIPFKYDPTDLTEDGIYIYHSSTNKIASSVADIIRAQPSFSTAANIDAFVVLVPGARQVTSFDRNSYGIGITKDFMAYHDFSVTFEDVNMLHAFYYVVVLDGHSLEQIAWERAVDDVLYQKRFKGNPALFVHAAYWAPSFDAITSSQREMIIADVQGMIRETLPETLHKLGLMR